MKAKLVVFASGTGTNFEAVARACEQGVLDATVELLIVNKPHAGAIQKAAKYDINFAYYNFKGDNYQRVIETIKNIDPDFIVLAGFMKVLNKEFVNTFKNKIINIHPSILPKYQGLRAIERAFENGDKETGVTIHYVDEGVDTGEIIAQEILEIEGLDLEQVEGAVHKVEHRLYVDTLRELLYSKKTKIKNQ